MNATDRAVVEATVRDLSPESVEKVRGIHKKMLASLYTRRPRLESEMRSVERAIEMRELALSLLKL